MCKQKGCNLRKHKLLALGFILTCVLVPLWDYVQAQANRTNSGDLACAAAGSSTEMLPQRSGRYSYTINNTSGADVRIGYLDSPSTVNLTATNSWLLKAGQPYSDSVPGVLNSRVVCMSTSASTATLSFNETYR